MQPPYLELETQLADWNGTGEMDDIVVCSSGTTALQLAFESLRLPPGSEVIVPEYTMIACARAVTMAGLEPVFIDCGKDLLIDVELLNKRTLKNVSAIMPVHIYGRQCAMEGLVEYAQKRNLYIVEDMSECHGVTPHKNTDAACWSFYGNKVVGGEEGGAVGFRDGADAELARSLRCLGEKPAHDFSHVPRGINARLSNAHALMILSSLSKFETNLRLRKNVEARYDRCLPKEWLMPPRLVPWVYDIRITESQGLQEIVEELNGQGVAARLGFKPMSSQQEYHKENYQALEAYRASREIMYLPITPRMNMVEVAGIVALTKEAINR